MAGQMSLEPFPLFVDSNGPFSPSHLSASKVNPFNLLSSKSPSVFDYVPDVLDYVPSVQLPSKITNEFRLRYYQYEVTFGLYVMTPMEKLILNTIVFTISAAMLYGVCFGLQPLLIRSLCRLAWYVYGTLEGVENVCTEAGVGGGCMT